MDLVRQAHALTQKGDLQGAARICRQILAGQPMHDYALYLLGAIEAESGNISEAVKYLSLAVRANPRSAEALLAYGGILREAKRPAEAADALTLALALNPANANALVLRGQALAESGNSSEALADFGRALKLDPRSVFALQNRAHLLIALKRYPDARADLETLLRLAPDFLPALMDSIAIANALENYADVVPASAKALALAPGNSELWQARGFALQKLSRPEEALHAYEKAVAHDPKAGPAYFNGANLLMEMQRLEDALGWIEKSLRADPKNAASHLLRGNILLHLSRRGEALASYDAAIAIRPDYADAHYHRGSLLLLQGRFREGLADFEYRWQSADCGFDRPKIAAPEWRGEALAGKSIVVYSEQGMGDTIQFVRFVPALARMGATVTFLCHPKLIALLRGYLPRLNVIPVLDGDHAFDYQCALMSLPYWLGTDLATIPDAAGYLKPDADRIAFWREKIGSHGFRVGIAWQGNPIGAIDKGRSMPLAAFAPLASIPGVRLISLQRVHGLEQLARLPFGMTVETLGEFDTGDDAFLDTAAIMASLDLIVTSDTAIPHLAGALGERTFLALKKIPDWRWMLGRSDSPWYASLTLFRQDAAGEWDGVLARIAAEVESLIAMRSPS